jgi:hypothetical protein
MLSKGEGSKEQRPAERSDRRIHAYNWLDREQQRDSDSQTRLAREDLPFISSLRRLREPFVKLQALSRFSHAFIVRKRGYSGTNFHVACVRSGERVS